MIEEKSPNWIRISRWWVRVSGRKKEVFVVRIIQNHEPSTVVILIKPSGDKFTGIDLRVLATRESELSCNILI